jgi:NADH:ubiquinone oxidoreductase subunit 5 (subunit L)/multisubunit Na+/H+ antiporter MnhA subunit
MANLLVIAFFLPLASFLVIIARGKNWRGAGRKIGTFAIGASLALSLVAWSRMGAAYNTADNAAALTEPNDAGLAAVGYAPVAFDWVTLPNGVVLQLGVWVDSLTVVMFTVVGLIGTCVHVFSGKYLEGDVRFDRYYAYLSLFCFSMLGLVISDNFFMIFIFWELVGISSYLLIGHWFEKKSAQNASVKAFVTNRVGDMGLIIGIMILLAAVRPPPLRDGRVEVETVRGTRIVADGSTAAGKGKAVSPLNFAYLFNHPKIQEIAHPGVPVPRASNPAIFGDVDISYPLLTVAGIALFFGAVGKSAQFPLQVWLPDAMEGPTPVSALIHAATMVAAGVYMTARMFPLLTPHALLFIAYIGLITLTIAALTAIVQTDIKKVLAYSTVSQLGYMILAVGLAAPAAALFHLFTHAFFKALLFLGSGAVIYAAHHEQDLRKMGGLRRKIPVTAYTFLIGCLAIAGFPPFLMSGFFSKEEILHAALTVGPATGHLLLLIVPLLIAGVTAFYMFRCYFLAFEGEPRDHHVYEHAEETPASRPMLTPLKLLAVLSFAPVCLVAMIKLPGNVHFGADYLEQKALHPEYLRKTDDSGHVTVGQQSMIHGLTVGAAKPAVGHGDHGHGPAAHAEPAHGTAAVGHGHGHAAHGHHEHSEFPGLLLMVGAITVAAGGITTAVLFYFLGLFDPSEKQAQFPGLYRLFSNKFYFDEMYDFVFVRGTLAISAGLAWFDRVVIDGAVNLFTPLAMLVSRVCGRHDAVIVDGVVNEMADATYSFGAGLRNVQGGQIRQYVQLLAAGFAGAAILLGASMLPGSDAVKAGLPAAVCAVVFGAILRRALTSPGRERAIVIVAVLAILTAMFPASPAVRVGWLALLTGLLTARLARWTLDKPDERLTVIPAAASLIALGWYLGSPLYVWGFVVGAVLEALFRTLSREAAATFVPVAAIFAAVLIPDSLTVRYAMAGWTFGMLATHAVGWIAEAAGREPEPATA